jgi:nitrate/nitrite-specific signal transduction histidine kinase
VNAAAIEDELWVIVSDDGSGMQPRRDSPGLGYGLKLIADAADEVTIVGRASAGTEVRMRFALRDGGGFGDDQLRGSVASATAPAPSSFSTTR